MAKIQGTIGDDFLPGTNNADTIEGKAGDDYIKGKGGNDLLKGDEGNDRIFGQAGNDDLQGDAGNDGLSGGTGDDTLEGGLGNDFLRGGFGADTFVFADINAGRDKIADFEDGIDKIQFDLATVNSMNDLTISQLDNGATLVAWDTGSVVLKDFLASNLTAADFLF